MKKLILNAAIMLFLVAGANAQSDRIFQKFKGDLSFGFVIPAGSGSSLGFCIGLEPKYAILDKLAVGIRIEPALMGRTTYDIYGDEDIELKAAASYIATAEYYFTNTKMRPFVGGGAGLYTFASTSFNSATSDASSTGFGGMVRAGFEVGHFRLGLEYNIVPSTDYTYTDFNGVAIKGVNTNGYIALKVGAFFGGSRLERLKKKHRRDD